MENLSFGQYIQQWRRSRNLTQEDLSKCAHCAKSTIKKIEGDDEIYRPSEDILHNIMRCLNIPKAMYPLLYVAARSKQKLPSPVVTISPLVTPTGTLPTPSLPLIGYVDELAESCALLKRKEVRLLTLTGAPGVGKTRLGLAIAEALRYDFVACVWVDLTSVEEAQRVPQALAHAFGIEESGVQPLIVSIKQYIHEQPVFLLFDNFEHVLQASLILPKLLAACPQVKIIVTSRENLNILAEHRLRLHGLSYPDTQSMPVDRIDRRTIEQFSALHFFFQQAGLLKQPDRITPEMIQIVSDICRQLSGLPFMLMLAAARTHCYSLSEIKKQLLDGAFLQWGGPRDHARTPYQTIAWSYKLLDPNEQALFRRMAIYVGGAALSDLVAMMAKEVPADLLFDEEQMCALFPFVESLIEKCLLQSMVQADGSQRLKLLEVVREFALDLVRHRGEEAQFCAAHAAYYLGHAAEGVEHIRDWDRQGWRTWFIQEHGNINAALHWVQNQAEVEAFVNWCGTLWPFWVECNELSVGRMWVQHALHAIDAVPPRVQAKLFSGACALAQLQGDQKQALAYGAQGLAILEEYGEQDGKAVILMHMGLARYAQGEFAKAEQDFQHSLALVREQSHMQSQARLLNYLGLTMMGMERYDDANTYLQDSLTLYMQAGDERRRLELLTNIGLNAMLQRRYMDTIRLLTSVLPSCRQHGDAWQQAATLCYLGFSMTCCGQDDDMLQGLCYIAESLQIRQRQGNKLGILYCFAAIARATAQCGDTEHTPVIYGAIETLIKTHHLQMVPGIRGMYNSILEMLQKHMDAEALADARILGQVQSLDQAIAYVLDVVAEYSSGRTKP